MAPLKSCENFLQTFAKQFPDRDARQVQLKVREMRKSLAKKVQKKYFFYILRKSHWSVAKFRVVTFFIYYVLLGFVDMSVYRDSLGFGQI